MLNDLAEIEAHLEAGETDDPFLLVPAVLQNSVRVGIVGALGHAGNKTEMLNLAEATRIALGNAYIAKSGLDGKHAFEKPGSPAPKTAVRD